MKKAHPWKKAYTGKERRKTPPQKTPRIEVVDFGKGGFTVKADKGSQVAYAPLGRRSAASPKTRRVFVTLELATEASLSDLRRHEFWGLAWYGRVIQVQANVARPER